MCDPQTVGTGSLALQSAGAGASAVGSYYAANGQKTTLTGQAGVDDTNAKIQEITAQSAILAGQRQEQASDIATANIKGKQRASFAANGLDPSSQTVQNVLNSTDTMGKVDANTIAANAVRTAWGYRVQATNFQNDALIKRTQADSISPWEAAGTSLLTSAASIASSRYQQSKAGVGANRGPMQGPTNDWLSRNFGVRTGF